MSLLLNGEGTGRPYTLAGQDQEEIMPMIFPLSQLMLTVRSRLRPSTQFFQRLPRQAAGYPVAAVLLLFLQQAGFLLVITAYILFGLLRAGTKAAKAILDDREIENSD